VVAGDLTDREREVLMLVREGKTNSQIARELWIAHGTVRKHLEHIYRKLGVQSRTAALARFSGR
jgi:DNA-binding CsgD family transcriptional regulator